jgi:hypothetical protein
MMFVTEIFILSLSLFSKSALSLSLLSLPLLAPPTIYIEKKEREKKRKRARERRRARVFLLRLRGDDTKTEQKQKRERETKTLFFILSPRSFVLGNSPLSQKSKKALSIRTYLSSSSVLSLSLSRVWLRFAFLLPKMKKSSSLSLLSLSSLETH